MAEMEACPTCGKVTYSFLHSCPGIPQRRQPSASGITEFLLARIAEDERAATVAVRMAGTMRDRYGTFDHERVLAECEAKRRIVEHCDSDYLTLSPGDPYVLQLLALPYADHPDYREEWKP